MERSKNATCKPVVTFRFGTVTQLHVRKHDSAMKVFRVFIFVLWSTFFLQQKCRAQFRHTRHHSVKNTNESRPPTPAPFLPWSPALRNQRGPRKGRRKGPRPRAGPSTRGAARPNRSRRDPASGVAWTDRRVPFSQNSPGPLRGALGLEMGNIGSLR
jgi:hypothetical protein